jgi:co-chaperonin GroES (HSP10)
MNVKDLQGRPLTEAEIAMRTMQHGHAQVEEGFPIIPFDDVVYVEQLKEEVSKGGIIIPDTKDAQKMSTGRVVAVGPGRIYGAAMNAAGTMETAIFMPSRLKVGDTVIWGRYRTGGEQMEINGKRYVCCREGDLGGVLREGHTLTGARYVSDAS